MRRILYGIALVFSVFPEAVVARRIASSSSVRRYTRTVNHITSLGATSNEPDRDRSIGRPFVLSDKISRQALVGMLFSYENAWKDLRSDEWEPLRTQMPFSNPCFLTSFLTLASVIGAHQKHIFLPFGVGPSLVLTSSVLYWHNPIKSSVRRSIDVKTVRTGLALQFLLAAAFCRPVSDALLRMSLGYGLGACCYAVGRILTVRNRLWAGAFVHCGVHVFANLGNLWILPFVK